MDVLRSLKQSGSEVNLPISDILSKPNLQPKAYDDFLVFIGNYTSWRNCNEPGRKGKGWNIVMKINMQSMLEYYPPVIRYRCELEFVYRRLADYTLRLVTANTSDEDTSFGDFVKQCRRKMINTRRRFKCDAMEVIKMADIGQSIYYCDLIANFSELICRSDVVPYNITTENLYVDHWKKLHEERKRKKSPAKAEVLATGRPTDKKSKPKKILAYNKYSQRENKYAMLCIGLMIVINVI